MKQSPKVTKFLRGLVTLTKYENCSYWISDDGDFFYGPKNHMIVEEEDKRRLEAWGWKFDPHLREWYMPYL